MGLIWLRMGRDHCEGDSAATANLLAVETKMKNSASASLVQEDSKDAQSVEDPWLGVDGWVWMWARWAEQG